MNRLIKRGDSHSLRFAKNVRYNLNSYSQTRPFISRPYKLIMSHWNLRQTKIRMDEVPNEQNTLEYIRAMSVVKPTQAATLIEEGWKEDKIPVNEKFMKEYFKVLGVTQGFDKVELSKLLPLLAEKNNKTVSGDIKSPKIDISTLIADTSSKSRGNKENPMHVISSQSTGQIFARLAGTVIMTLAGLTLIYSLMDEKVSGSAGAAAGAVGARMGGGSIVRRAESSDKTFADVVGIDEAKSELEEIVMYLQNPRRFTRLGGRLPKGVLLTGPPGTGKTLLAKAIAGEADVPFFHTSGSEFEEMYVGVGAKRVRELFNVAKTHSPCIIFIDEIDAIGGSRHLKDQSAMKMTLNQLLVEMDGFQQNSGIIVIAATNFANSLDKALVRPGRFDKHIDVPMPDIGGRKKILDLYGKKVPLDSDVDMDQLARGTPGFSGAELFNLINQAALKASVDGLKSVGMAALEYAKDKIMMGAERKSAIISPETMKTTAFHEAGHALVALKTDGADPVHKATIMPRGRALGMVMQLPEGDQVSMSKKQMLARLDVCMGGRIAEEVVFGPSEVTSGASSDLQQATRLAKLMVTRYGLNDKVGLMVFDDKAKMSGATQQLIDDEVKKLLTDSYARAKKLIEENREALNLIAKGLMEYESLSGSELVGLMSGQEPNLAKRSMKASRNTPTVNTTTSDNSGAISAEKNKTISPAVATTPFKSNLPTGEVGRAEDKKGVVLRPVLGSEGKVEAPRDLSPPKETSKHHVKREEVGKDENNVGKK